MCPSIAVLAGGGDGGGGSSKGGSGGGGNGAGTGSGGEDADGDGRSAKSGSGGCGGSGGCPGSHGGGGGSVAKGDPVDVVTGRVFTLPALDVDLPGLLPLAIARTYSSFAATRDIGLGYGWSHSLAWTVEIGRSSVRLWKGDSTDLLFELLPVGAGAIGPDGLLISREAWGFVVESSEGLQRVFSVKSGEHRYRLGSIRDRYGNRIVLDYRDDRLVEIVDSVGRTVRVVSTPEGRIASFEVKNAVVQGRWIQLARYTYDGLGDLVAAEDADGYATAYDYEDHLLVAHEGPTGLAFHFVYDDARRCIESWGAYSERGDPGLAASVPAFLADGTTRARGIYHIKLDFHDDGYSEVVDSVQAHRFFGNEQGKLDKAVGSGGVHSRSYDDLGNVLSYTDPLEATTTWVRDARGRELAITDPLGRTTTIERDPDGSIRDVIDPAGGTTQVVRGAGSLSWRDPIGALFQVNYDKRGLATEAIAPNGASTRYRYDAHGNVVERIDGMGRKTRFLYDFFGRCLEETDDLGATFSFAYSPRGDLLARRGPDGGVTRYTHDGAGNLTAIADACGRTTTFTYGGYNRLCEVKRPNGEVARLRYDREGRLVEVHKGRGEVHHFELNAAGLIVGERTFDGRHLIYGYDRAGRRSYRINGLGEKTEYVRDLAGQLIERIYADGTRDEFAYNLRGEFIAAKNASGEVLFERNALGWITKEIQTFGGETMTVELSYDLMGNLARRETSRGHTAEWVRDAAGQCERVILDKSEEVTLLRDSSGREVARVFDRGGRVDTAYDEMDRIIRRVVSSPSPASRPVEAGEPAWIGPGQTGMTVDQAYRYSPASELVESWDRARGATRFELDPAGQLLAVVPEHLRAELFRYDEAGNLFEAASGAAPRAYGPGGRLLTKGDAEYAWDAEGRLREIRRASAAGEVGVTRLAWAPSGRLASVERPDGMQIEFEYDAFARRMIKRASVKAGSARGDAASTTVRFVWDAGRLVHEMRQAARDAGDPSVEERTYCIDEGNAPWAQREVRRAGEAVTGGGWHYYLNDHLGTPERLIDARGEVVCELQRSAWGKVIASAGATASTPLRFQGQYEDEETGLFYNWFRYYDPDAGRYISADPAGVYASLNAFSYADNSPTTAVDPDGLMPFAVIKDAKGNVVHKGASGGKDLGGGIDSAMKGQTDRESCGEFSALNKMAKQIRGKDENMSDEAVHDKMREMFQNGFTIEAQDDNGNPMAPCQYCGQMFKNLGIHPDNIDKKGGADAPGGVMAPNTNSEKKKGKLPPWKGKSHENAPGKFKEK